MNHTQSAAGLGGQPQPQQQPQFNMASAFFGHYGPATANNMIHHHQRGFVTSTPVQSSNGLNLSSSSGSASASSSSSSGLNSSSSPEDGKVEKLSRSHQYKKIMKPLLERKRRARINKCLDELKDIMTAALQSQGENVSKLEKADILELTVRHLHKMQQARRLMTTSRNPLEEIHRFQAGYSSCAQEAASFLLSTPGVDITVGQRLLAHLSSNISNPITSALHNTNSNRTPPAVHQAIPPALPATSPTSSTTTTTSSPPISRFENLSQPHQKGPHLSSSTSGHSSRLGGSGGPPPLRSTPLRRSSSPGTLSPSKRLFHSPPLSTSGGQLPSLPPRPSSTPVNNNNYSVMVTVTSTASSDDDDLLEEEDGGGQKMPIKPSPIRLHPNDPVWRPF